MVAFDRTDEELMRKCEIHLPPKQPDPSIQPANLDAILAALEAARDDVDASEQPPADVVGDLERGSRVRAAYRAIGNILVAGRPAGTRGTGGGGTVFDMAPLLLLPTGPEDGGGGGGSGEKDREPVRMAPGYFEGELQESLAPELRQRLERYILPSPGASAALPNLVLEAVGTLGWPHSMRRALYAGALCARAMHVLRTRGGRRDNTDTDADADADLRPGLDGAAYAIAGVYRGASWTLELFTVHPCAAPGVRSGVGYRMVSLGSCRLGPSKQEYWEGVTVLRNASDWADGQRKALLSGL